MRSTKAEGLTPATLNNANEIRVLHVRSTKAEGLTPATLYPSVRCDPPIQSLNKG